MRGIEAINQKRVLLIGDDPSEMRRLGEMIAAQGLQVVQTADRRLGLRLARQQHPDLIVLHIESSGMSALAVAQHLKADDDTRGIPLVVITAYAKVLQEELHAEVLTDLITLLPHRRRLPTVSRLPDKGRRPCGNLGEMVYRPHCRLCAVVNADLAKQAPHVNFHCRFGDIQLSRYVLI